MNAVEVDKLVQAIGAQELNGRVDADAISLRFRTRAFGTVVGKPGQDDGRVLIQLGVIADVFQCRQNFQILQIALGDLLGFRIVIEVVEAEVRALSGQRKFRIKGRPIDFVAEFQAGEDDVVLV